MRHWILVTFILVGCGGSDKAPYLPASSALAPEPPAPSEENPPAPATQGVELETITWGTEPEQFGVLYRPEAAAKAPVVVMIHGGCWLAPYDLTLQSGLSQALAERGFAVWNIEYRRLGNGGEWPVLFQDVAAAVDYLGVLEEEYDLDLQNVAAMGHSAGGHLALWLISRHKISNDSALFVEQPLSVKGAVTLGGIGSLQSGSCSSSARQLIAAESLSENQLELRLANSSPIHMLATGAHSILISGEDDGIVPPRVSEDYVQAAVSAGDFSEHLIIDNAGHFDLISSRFMDMALIEDSLRRVLASE